MDIRSRVFWFQLDYLRVRLFCANAFVESIRKKEFYTGFASLHDDYHQLWFKPILSRSDLAIKLNSLIICLATSVTIR